MKKQMINSVHIEGYVYQLGTNTRDVLEEKVTKETSKNPGTKYIAGTIQVAVDENGLNVIPVHFTYVTPTTSAGKANSTYSALKKIIDGPTWIKDGKENAIKVKIDTALALNEFYSDEVDENGEERLVKSKIHEGGFVTIVSELSEPSARNTFKVDMYITSIKRKEAKDEDDKEYAIVDGAIFNFRKEILPINFIIKNKQGISYFEDLDISRSNPIFTSVWGTINCETVTQTVTEESAFGEPSVKTYERKNKEWVITGTKKEPYEFGDEKILTSEEVTEANKNRSIYLAELKKAKEDYKNNKKNDDTTLIKTIRKNDDFNF